MSSDKPDMNSHISPYSEIIKCSKPSTSNYRSTQLVTITGQVIPTESLQMSNVTPAAAKAFYDLNTQAINNTIKDMNIQANRELQPQSSTFKL